MNKSPAFSRQPRFSKDRLWASLISAFFVLLTIAFLFTPVAGPLRYGFPALSFFFAFLVYRQSKPFYAGFVVWLWMLAPLVRRVVEYRAGGSASLVLSAPFLACAVPLLLNLTSLGELFTAEGYPILFAGAGIAYGLGVGVLTRNHIPNIAIDLSFWIAPLLFAFFVLRFRSQIHEIRTSIEKAFIWGAAVIGAYGIYQYFVLAPWDAVWMESVHLASLGFPEPQQVRVFSTMNNPQICAAFLVAGIFFATKSHRKIKWLALPVATLSLLLTESRTAWLGFLVGFAYLFFYLPVRQKLQITVAGMLSAALVVVALQGPQKDILASRFQSFLTPSQDSSVGSRLGGYAVLLPELVSSPFGVGIGIDESSPDSPTSKGGEGLGFGDSAILALLFELGIPGALVYLVGVRYGARASFGGTLREDVGDVLASRAIIISLAISLLATNVITGSGGFLFWTAIMLAATRHKVTVADAITSEAPRRLAMPQLSKSLGSSSLGPRTS